MTNSHTSVSRHTLRRNSALALSPLLVMLLLFGVLGMLSGGLHKIPLLLVFLCTAAYSLFTLRGLPTDARLHIFSKGAGEPTLLLMIWIFVLAGAFAASAKEMGAIEATVNLCVKHLPASLLLPGVFLAACLISLAIGTSVGTIVALVPIASGMAQTAAMPTLWFVGAVVGGAFFGDNLSFISDTTIAATKTQGCQMRDKFKMNFRIALPAALLTLGIYAFLGKDCQVAPHIDSVNLWLVLPYAVVLLAALAGGNVLSVLGVGVALCGIIGIATETLSLNDWFTACVKGIADMGELILISMLAGGLLAVMRKGGGITWLLRLLTQRIKGRRGAEASIALLVSMTNLCTANNTVAILSVGNISRDISQRFGIDPRRSASILDTFSCVTQGLIPYGAQLLIAGGLASVAPTTIMPWLFYPYLLGAVMALHMAWGKSART